MEDSDPLPDQLFAPSVGRPAPLDVCTGCGTVLDRVTEALAARGEIIDSQREDIANLEHELRVKRQANRRLIGEQDKIIRDSPEFNDAVEVLEHWRALCSPKARELSGKRLTNCVARLRAGYTVAELNRAVWGYSLKPYVVNGGKRSAVGSREDWFADAELIFRDENKVHAGLRIADREEDYRNVLQAGGVVVPEPAPIVVPSLSDLGAAALRYVTSNRWWVFPCREREKVPATPHGLDDAKCDTGAVQTCWTAHPNLNVAVRTGAPSGIVVLDVDGEEGAESLQRLETQHGALPPTASVKTPRGGSHYYFRHPGGEVRNTAGWPGPGLDIRGDGGYVLAPPSVGPGGRRYEPDEQATVAPLPPWLLALIVHRQDVRRRGATPQERARLIGDDVTEGSRNERVASHVGWLLHHHDHVVARELAHVWNEARLKPSLSRVEVDRTVDSVIRRATRAPTA